MLVFGAEAATRPTRYSLYALTLITGQLGLGHLANFRLNSSRDILAVIRITQLQFCSCGYSQTLPQGRHSGNLHRVISTCMPSSSRSYSPNYSPACIQLSASLAHSCCLSLAPQPLHAPPCEPAASASPLRPKSFGSAAASPLKRGQCRSH